MGANEREEYGEYGNFIKACAEAHPTKLESKVWVFNPVILGRGLVSIAPGGGKGIRYECVFLDFSIRSN